MMPWLEMDGRDNIIYSCPLLYVVSSSSPSTPVDGPTSYEGRNRRPSNSSLFRFYLQVDARYSNGAMCYRE
jgi:hypothetical protein